VFVTLGLVDMWSSSSPIIYIWPDNAISPLGTQLSKETKANRQFPIYVVLNQSAVTGTSTPQCKAGTATGEGATQKHCHEWFIKSPSPGAHIQGESACIVPGEDGTGGPMLASPRVVHCAGIAAPVAAAGPGCG
jgi:hypothetical protein